MQTITLEFKKHPMKPPKFIRTYPRLKFTLILLTLLFIGVAAKADVPCHTAIEVQQATIDSLQAKLATAQTVPYNQGYQEGYKVAKLEGFTANEIGGLILLVTVCIIMLAAIAGAIYSALKD